jgi:GNAT superfamily N-acetyltransferase
MAERSVDVRRHYVEDIDVLEPLWQSLHSKHQEVGPGWCHWWPSDRSWQIRRSRYLEWLSMPDSFALVAWRDESPVGYAVVHVSDGPDDTWVTGDRIGALESLSVAEGHRGAGIGTKLMSAVMTELRDLGVQDLWISVVDGNDRALTFYARYGFRPLMTTLGGRVSASDAM